jgi:hypothetical protein
MRHIYNPPTSRAGAGAPALFMDANDDDGARSPPARNGPDGDSQILSCMRSVIGPMGNSSRFVATARSRSRHGDAVAAMHAMNRSGTVP